MLGTIRVGHAQDTGALTGCTVFLPPAGSVAACEVRGGAPGTRETAMLSPAFTVECPNAILFTGGSAFGLVDGQKIGRAPARNDIAATEPEQPRCIFAQRNWIVGHDVTRAAPGSPGNY